MSNHDKLSFTSLESERDYWRERITHIEGYLEFLRERLADSLGRIALKEEQE